MKKHYMRVKRKILQEESFIDDLSKIAKRLSPESNKSVTQSPKPSTSVTQSELFQSNTVELNLTHNESDESNEYFSLPSPNLINSSTYMNMQEDNLEGNIKSSLTVIQWSLKHNVSHSIK